MKQFARSHPLLCVLSVAALVRLCSVLWSKGFVHSDDYYDTVTVAYNWLVNGFWGSNGFLTWNSFSSETVGRFPLYTLFLWLIMKLFQLFGSDSLNTMMYGIRAAHAAISLLPVWAVWRITRQVTGRDSWAVTGGLMVALQFAMPFLGVRNLIEMVGGNVWIVVFVFLYRHQTEARGRLLLYAGLVSGLAWMLRFQIAFAVIPIPFVLWFEARKLRPAVLYSSGVAVMLLFSVVADYYLLGRFAGSTINNLIINVGQAPLYKTIPFLYPALLLLLLVPPFSLAATWAMFNKRFFVRHRALVISFLVFLIWHMATANQQERFILPMLPVFLLMAILALWERFLCKGEITANPRTFTRICVISSAINLGLLVPVSLAYGHRGLIESVLSVRKLKPEAHVLFVQPDMRPHVPIAFADRRSKAWFVRDWAELPRLSDEALANGPVDYVVIFPTDGRPLEATLDSVAAHLGPMTQVTHITASYYDQLLYRLNPKHNDSFEAYIFRPEEA
ncbi:MAG: glycosyltransferase family 39 protein [Candidatus Zixiibacteriota bacterium]